MATKNYLHEKPSLVSVIIPCYNHGHYLPKAIESVRNQTYPAVEIIVIDDGSTDNTREVAEKNPQVKYIYQANQGLPATRNAGIRHSTGEYVVFLDADDWLYPQAIEVNLRHLQQHASAAFVSGAYDSVFEEENVVKEVKIEISSNHFLHLLKRNYIAVPAAVLYRKWVFDEFLFEEELKSCEDYDLYLKVARKYPIIHHMEKVVAYRKHSSNMSANTQRMLATALLVLKRQEGNLVTGEEKRAFKKGIAFWKRFYCRQLYLRLLLGKTAVSASPIYLFWKYRPLYIIRYFLHRPLDLFKLI